MMKRNQYFFPIVLTMLFSSAVGGLEVGLDVGYGAEYNSNADLTDVDEVEELVQRPQASLNVRHDANNIVVGANYQYSKELYKEDDSRDESLVEGSGFVSWNTLGDFLTVDLRNSRTQRTISSVEQNIPENQQVVDQSSVAAALDISTFGNHSLELAGQFEHVNAETTDSDSDRYQYSAAYIVPQQADGSIALRATQVYVDFDQRLASDYTTDSLELEYLVNTGDLSASLGIGRSKTRRSGRDRDLSQNIGNAEITWRLGGTSSVIASWEKSVQDNTLDQANEGIGPIITQLVDNSGSNDVFVEKISSLAYNGQLGRNEVQLNIFNTDLNFVDTPLDENRKGVRLALDRDISNRLSASFAVGYTEFDFSDASRRSDDTTAQLGLSYQANRRLGLDFSVGYFERESDVVAEPDADATFVTFSFTYAILQGS